MKISKKIFRLVCLSFLSGLLLITPLLGGCEETPDTTTTSEVKPMPFALNVWPLHMDDAIEGANYVFLVTVDYGTMEPKTTTTEDTTTAETGGATTETTQTIDPNLARISATAENAYISVGPKGISEGYVAEVVVVPDEGTAGSIIRVRVKAEWQGYSDTETITLNVQEKPESLEELTSEAISIRNTFISWVATNCPELGISLDESWYGTVVYPNTVVIKYFLFFSEKWEVGIRWNTSTSSVDWAQMYIRLRTAQFTPSQSFEIDSLSATNKNIYEISPHSMVWR
ncbi:MAG TPA: hypothetical protein DCR71_03815 [Dehalococcoidia bacterium]|jgi:hypothetical protein|nr:hypothetical protein [Dehalococcoidia bacterium]HAS27766.1 hypothetical protein [Dehalococcoidia bacterium]